MKKKNTLLPLFFAFAFAFIVCYPIFYAFLGSFFSAKDFTSTPVKLFPSSFSFANYEKALSHKYFLTYTLNSVITSVMGTALRCLVSYAAAYAFAFYRFKGSRVLLGLLLGTLFIPSDLLLVENYITIQKAGLIDTYPGIISTGVLSATMILMLRQFFLSIPRSLIDVAEVDGAGHMTITQHIILPLSKAVFSALMLQSFVSFFNSYLWPLLVTNKPKMRTVQVGITMLGYSESLNYGPLLAAIASLLLPFILLFSLMKRRIMEALKNGYMYF